MAIIDFDIDKFMDEIGHFGTSGAYLCFELGIFFTYSSIVTYSYSFVASVVKHRCLIPECENKSTVVFSPAWLNNTMDITSFPQCKRYKPLKIPEKVNSSYCPAEWFDKRVEIPCKSEDLIFEENERSVLRQWNIYCEESKAFYHKVIKLHCGSLALGFLVFGVLSDIFGRRIILIISVFLACVVGLLKFISWNPLSFLILDGLMTCFSAGIYSTALVLAIEVIGKKAHMTVAAMVFSFYALGLIYLAIGFSYEKNWRKYLYIHVAFLPTVLLYFILPESTRWLKVKGKEKRLIKELLRLAKLKGIEMKAENLDKFRATDRNKEVLRTKIDDRFVEVHQKEEENKSDEQDLKETEEGGDSIKISSNISMPLDQESQIKPVKLKKTEILPNSKLKIKPPSLLRILRSKVLVLRFFTCLLTWTILAFVYTTSLTSVDKFRYGDKYANFLLSSMVEIPAYFLTPVMSADFGRKKLLAGTLLVNSVLFIILALVSNSDMLKTGMVIKHVILIGNTLAYAVVSILTIELFPTNWRQTIFCICCAISRIGQPTYHLWIPVYFVNTELYLFGGFSLATGILVLFMPETAEENLPDTVEEAEALTIKHGKFWFTKSKSKFY